MSDNLGHLLDYYSYLYFNEKFKFQNWVAFEKNKLKLFT